MILKKYKTSTPVVYFDGKTPVEIPNYCKRRTKVRGIWVSNVANIDTPIMKDVESYKQYLKDMIKRIAEYNFNLIIFQVRPTNDAYYESKLNPWSRFITGTEGQHPGFDVLQFVIEEAKKYNIEIHAWMNPYRVGVEALDKINLTKEEYLAKLSPTNFARLHPEETIVDGTQKVILKPASQKVIDFVTATIMEVVENYDVTGVHIDDYFYPYAKVDRALEEEDYQARLKENPELSFDDFRRDNVDRMIKSVHDAMKKSFSKTKKKVAFGISPFAIYRTHSSLKEGGWDRGSLHTAGATQCYADLYSDVYKWMKEGWIDYVVPQVYFSFERTDVNYHDLTKWWNDIVDDLKIDLYIGHGLYQMGSNEVWANPKEIDNQLRFNAQYKNISGSIFFTYKDIVPGQNETKDKGIELLKKRFNTNK
ncbi:MAG: family 10 glycosylhydrolase [Bacilli bacterium]|nr:family 10 glycosylhydrolase [Bacilli bacterium]